MTNSKHTPGPWTLDTDGWKLTAAVRNEAGEHVALCRRDADAALIAAAPDLLAAMEIIAKELTNLGVHGRLPNAALAIVARLLGEARAAIAKAEGR